MNITPEFEKRLRAAGRGFTYPRTPDVSRAVRVRLARRPSGGISLRFRVAALLLALLAAALAVPDVRAKLIEFFQIGVIRILPAAPTATSALEPTLGPQPTRTPTPEPQPAHIISLAGLAGETTLEAADAQLYFPILLPTYPAALGPPDRAFLQDDGPMVVLVWSDPDDPDRARLSLHEIGPRSVLIDKYQPRVIQETQVNGEYAIWVEGPYMIQLATGHADFRRLVDGNTLIWRVGTITYRLESTLSLEEAVKIAESLQ